MANLYADENFPFAVVEHLRLVGHDVLTVQEANRQGEEDAQVLAFATAANRAVVTLNRRHFIRLHSQIHPHGGIIVCTDDEALVLAQRIDHALAGHQVLANLLLRINRTP